MADTTTIATWGHFGTVTDRIVAIATQGHFLLLEEAPVAPFIIELSASRPSIKFTAKRPAVDIAAEKPTIKMVVK